MSAHHARFDDISDLDLNAILHPASAFDHPQDVLNDPDLTRYEKRAILSSWASDACAIESMPGYRMPMGSNKPVPLDDIIDALRSLDDPPPRPGGKSMRVRPPQRPYGGPAGESEAPWI